MILRLHPTDCNADEIADETERASILSHLGQTCCWGEIEVLLNRFTSCSRSARMRVRALKREHVHGRMQIGAGPGTASPPAASESGSASRCTGAFRRFGLRLCMRQRLVRRTVLFDVLCLVDVLPYAISASIGVVIPHTVADVELLTAMVAVSHRSPSKKPPHQHTRSFRFRICVGIAPGVLLFGLP